jgi:predicted Zn-dependent protease
MSGDRIEALEGLREKDPANSLTLLMLANEYFKLERWSDTVAILRDYLARKEDEGAAYRLLGLSLRRLGDEIAARQAFLQGADCARQHGHDGMANELDLQAQG